jgi:CDP-diacylglycerol---glycerol-3-phosphate 3-phosphatidyltransferase
MPDTNTENRSCYRDALERGREAIGSVLGSDTPRGRVTVTIANYLTIGRLLVVPFFWYGFFSSRLWLQIAASLLFALGALSDLWDGKLARRHGQVTAFGNFMDPFADKALVLSGFWALLFREDFGNYEATAVLWACLITIREVALTIFRVKIIKSGSALVTSLWGKWKTGVELTCLLFALTALNVRDALIYFYQATGPLGSSLLFLIFDILFLLSALTSLISGYRYLYGNDSLRSSR